METTFINYLYIGNWYKIRKRVKNFDEKNEIESLDIINQNAQYLSKTIDDFRNYFKKAII